MSRIAEREKLAESRSKFAAKVILAVLGIGVMTGAAVALSVHEVV